MQIVVHADDRSKEELVSQGVNAAMEIVWIENASQFKNYPSANAFIDLVDCSERDRAISVFQELPTVPVIINQVTLTLKDLPANFIRINGWPTFLNRSIIEGSCSNDFLKKEVEEIFSHFSKKIEWIPDVPGFISARIIAMIVNEAYFTFGEGVSSKEETDIAMKLGTNYPFGPFEWSKRIGLDKIALLLTVLGNEQPRYAPAPLLLKETGS